MSKVVAVVFRMEDIEDLVGVDVRSTPTAQVLPNVKLTDKTESKDPSIPGTQLLWFKTYGCAHNVSDSEYMQGTLAAYGYQFCSNKNNADLWCKC